ncbi:MAG: hypothetical protein NTZ25_03735 [Candidatus Peregrinibacteria bacterium]|nr:hypothetical protein [Candidatus Peregrinibacteria bacterium]
MKTKAKEWLKRYLPAELFALTCSMLGAVSVFVLTKNRILAAYAGTLGEVIGFYGAIFVIEKINYKKSPKPIGLKKTIRNLLVEFGFSEFLDGAFIRPSCLYIFPLIIGQFSIGILTGKVAADVVFYILTICAYELRKKHLKD